MSSLQIGIELELTRGRKQPIHTPSPWEASLVPRRRPFTFDITSHKQQSPNSIKIKYFCWLRTSELEQHKDPKSLDSINFGWIEIPHRNIYRNRTSELRLGWRKKQFYFLTFDCSQKHLKFFLEGSLLYILQSVPTSRPYWYCVTDAERTKGKGRIIYYHDCVSFLAAQSWIQSQIKAVQSGLVHPRIPEVTTTLTILHGKNFH